jgi:hypothetical protein
MNGLQLVLSHDTSTREDVVAHPHHHAISSARRFGGVPDDYLAVHNFLDSTKASWADHRHRAVLHHSYGIFLAEQMFGLREEVRILRRLLDRIPRWLQVMLGMRIPNASPVVMRVSSGRDVPIRQIAEQHVLEDCGFIPTLDDYLGGMPKKPWMYRGATRLQRQLEEADEHQEPLEAGQPMRDTAVSAPGRTGSDESATPKPRRRASSRAKGEHRTTDLPGESIVKQATTKSRTGSVQLNTRRPRETR